MTNELILREIIKNKKIIFSDMKDWKIYINSDPLRNQIIELRDQGWAVQYRIGEKMRSGSTLNIPFLEHKFLKDIPGWEYGQEFESPLRHYIRGIRAQKEKKTILLYDDPDFTSPYTFEEIEYINSHLEDDFE